MGRVVPAWLSALSLALVFVGTGCGDEGVSMTYSADEVLRAFETAGYPVVEQPPPAGTPAAAEGIYLVPKRAAPLVVVVGTDQEADEVWPDYVRLGGDEDSLTVRRANVVAISDGGLTPLAKARVRAAMNALPDRGYAVDVVEIGSVASGVDLRIYDPRGQARWEVRTADVVRSSVYATRLPGGLAALYFRLTKYGALKFHRLTRALARRGVRLHRSQSFVFRVDGQVRSRPLVDYRAFPDGLDGRSGIQIDGLKLATAQRLAREIRRG